MLTPRFELSQTDDDITIIIHAPYANIKDTEIDVDDNDFRFYSAPYYLRLHLPGAIEETDASRGNYDADAGKFIVCLSKVVKGQNFPNLDLITSLLTPRRNDSTIQPNIEVIGANAEEVDSAEEDEWFIEQTVPDEPENILNTQKYGFANQKVGVFQNFKHEFAEIIELPDPDVTCALQRSVLRRERENADFCEDHYLADLMEPGEISHLLEYVVPWEKMLAEGSEVVLTPEELDVMKELPNREYLLDADSLETAFLGLVDILAAYCYNHRTTLGENTSESAWTINKLSATLSWFQCFRFLSDVAITVTRRSLCYPLYRHWDLTMKVLQDVGCILQLGKKQVLKCLLEIHRMFNKSEPRYLLNQLYIRDYCVWIQQASANKLSSVSKAWSKVYFEKSDLPFELDELEMAAKLTLAQEDFSATEITETLNQMTLSTSGVKAMMYCEQLGTKSPNTPQAEDVCTSDSESSSSESDDSDSSSSATLDSDDLTSSEDEN